MEKQRKNLKSKWSGILTRCNNKNVKEYKNYGGRGITVEWGNFEEFYRDMLPTYKTGLTIERINVNGNYSKTNCRWATIKEQQNNRRNNHVITFNGETKNLTEWATLKNMRHGLLIERLKRGWSIEKTLTTPAEKKPSIRLLIVDGITRSISAWAREVGISEHTIRERIKVGLPSRQAIFLSPKPGRNNLSTRRDARLLQN